MFSWVLIQHLLRVLRNRFEDRAGETGELRFKYKHQCNEDHQDEDYFNHTHTAVIFMKVSQAAEEPEQEHVEPKWHNDLLFSFVDKTGELPKTGARSSEHYKEFFTNAIKKYNADALIHIALSSEISSSCQNAIVASQELENVKVIDSRSLSSGCGLLALKVADKIDEGKSFEEVCDEAEKLTEKIQASFVIDKLNYLYKGGRCSAVAMFGANILRIKPKIKLADGKMGVDKKYMGKFENVVLTYANDIFKEHTDIDKTRVFVTYTSENDEINKKFEEILKEKGFNEIIFNFAGSTIASHCGRNTLGVLFINN